MRADKTYRLEDGSRLTIEVNGRIHSNRTFEWEVRAIIRKKSRGRVEFYADRKSLDPAKVEEVAFMAWESIRPNMKTNMQGFAELMGASS